MKHCLEIDIRLLPTLQYTCVQFGLKSMELAEWTKYSFFGKNSREDISPFHWATDTPVFEKVSLIFLTLMSIRSVLLL